MVSNIWLCEHNTMNNVPHVELPTYASYAPTPYVTDLCFIGCYAQCYRSLSCLVLKLTSHDITLYLYTYATCKYYVINNVLLARSHVKA